MRVIRRGIRRIQEGEMELEVTAGSEVVKVTNNNQTFEVWIWIKSEQPLENQVFYLAKPDHEVPSRFSQWLGHASISGQDWHLFGIST